MQKHPPGNMNEKAGLGARFLAIFLDGIIVGIVAIALSFLLGAAILSGGGDGALALVGVLYLLFPIAVFLYYIGMEAVYGYTLGKLALGIVVKSEDGGPIGWGASAVRNILRIVDVLPTLYLIGAILIMTSDENQRVGDIAASTVVVETA